MSKKTLEVKYYGYHACLKLWEKRPDDVIRVYVEPKLVKSVAPLLKWCSSKSKAYHLISSEELAKVADSVHHEGLCILARELKPINFPELLVKLRGSKDPACLLYLDGVQNPHNIGAIMRVAAHFGVLYLLGENLPRISPSTYRMAQGGAEYVHMVSVDNVKRAFQKLQEMGFVFISTSSHRGKSLFVHRFHPRTVIMMGSESEGIQKQLDAYAKESLIIPGTGLVESLNVSVATGLILGEYWRQLEK